MLIRALDGPTCCERIRQETREFDQVLRRVQASASAREDRASSSRPRASATRGQPEQRALVGAVALDDADPLVGRRLQVAAAQVDAGQRSRRSRQGRASASSDAGEAPKPSKSSQARERLEHDGDQRRGRGRQAAGAWRPALTALPGGEDGALPSSAGRSAALAARRGGPAASRAKRRGARRGRGVRRVGGRRPRRPRPPRRDRPATAAPRRARRGRLGAGLGLEHGAQLGLGLGDGTGLVERDGEQEALARAWRRRDERVDALRDLGGRGRRGAAARGVAARPRRGSRGARRTCAAAPRPRAAAPRRRSSSASTMRAWIRARADGRCSAPGASPIARQRSKCAIAAVAVADARAASACSSTTSVKPGSSSRTSSPRSSASACGRWRQRLDVARGTATGSSRSSGARDRRDASHARERCASAPPRRPRRRARSRG